MRDTGPIILPLDGSDLAEGALPYAEAMARALGTGVRIVTVWEGSEEELNINLPDVARDIRQAADEHFNGYLEKARANITGVDVTTELRTGAAEQEILRAAEDTSARLIVIATHGRSGISRWVYGSTAGHILRNGSVPVLAAGPHALENTKRDVTVKHIMCPLDGSDLSKSAIPTAVAVAKAAGARLSLVRVVPWAVQAYPFTLPGAYVPQVDDELEEGAKAYLRKIEAEIDGVERAAFVVRGAVTEGLHEFVDKESVDLVVMSTRARGGLARAALGSVADRMLQSSAPVLMVPAGE
jgi:nucleotide-binding universal stress UspA family protein